MQTQSDGDRASAGFLGFYRKRRRVYGALLLFVLVAGVPMAAIPKLRDRLIERAWNLKEAVAGKRAPVQIQVGQNQEPLPPEFQRPAPPPVPAFQPLPQPAKVYSTDKGGYSPRREPSRTFPSKESVDADASAPAIEEESGGEAGPEPEAADNELRYQQGTVERQAYDLLISSIPAVAAIVNGNNPSFQFKSWDAAGRGEDIYWVRLKLQAEGQPEGDYIWQIRLEAKQATPLNYNARNIR